MLGKSGYELHRKDRLGYNSAEQALAAIPQVRHATMIADAALISLWDMVRHCEQTGLQGAYVECGVWKGGAAGMIALANQAYAKEQRPLHLFDVFDDICEPDPAVDGEKAIAEVAEFTQASGELKPVKGIYDRFGGAGNADEVTGLLSRLGYHEARLHIGWFQDTLPQNEIEKIAILRLDGDWYASTKICLDHLYDKVVPGGFVVIDDYGTYEGCRKAVDEFLATQPRPPYINAVNQDVRYLVKP